MDAGHDPVEDTLGGVFVFAPDPVVTVTVEAGAEGDEIHFHAGGQGVWVSRMVECLDVPVTVCGPFGGEAGRVVRTLVESEGVSVLAVETQMEAGAYVHDRRSGERLEVAAMAPEPLGRHEVDELYGAVLVGALEAVVCVLAGPGPWDPPPVPAEMYRRLATDLRANARVTVADLSGEPLSAALEGGISVLKVSHEELMADGRAADNDEGTLVDALRRLRSAGADHVVLTRGADPALALIGDDLVEVQHPRLEAVDHRGAGDSLTAGLAAGLAQGRTIADALRMGAAAGALNVTRRGLATGDRRAIEQLAEHVELRPLSLERSPTP